MTRFAADITPSVATITRLTEDVTDFLQSAGVDARTAHHVALVLDEILTNMATHGEPPGLHATVVIHVEPDRVLGEIGDRGKPFDPRDAAPPDLAAALEDRKIGGLGLHLVRQLTSSLDYRSDDNQNWTTFCILRGQEQVK